MEKYLTNRNLFIVFIILTLIIPFITDNRYLLHVLSLTFIWTIAVYGLNLISGFTGQLSLAHAGFFGIGAYSVGLLTVRLEMNFWLALFLACMITTFIGFIISIFSLRTKEHFFAIYTLCVGYIIYLLIYKWDSLTGGVRGLIGIPTPDPIGPISFQTPKSQYYLLLFFLILVIFLNARLINSLVGRTFIAIRNSEELAQTIGIHTMKEKMISFILSTFFAGLAGGLYASFVRFIGPDISSITVTFELLTYLIIGGIGTLLGPIIGTFLVVWLSQYLQFLADYRILIFGPIIVLLIIFYPHGIAGAFDIWRGKRMIKVHPLITNRDKFHAMEEEK